MSNISLRDRKINWNLLKVIFCLAGPTMLEQFLQTAVQYVDTAMVSSLGTRATAAVGATATVNWLVGTTISAFGVGFLGFISQAIGAGNVDRAKKAAGQAVFIAVSVGLLFTAIVLGVARFVPAWMQVDQQVQSLAATYFFIIYSPLLFRTFTIIFGTVLRAAGDTKSPMKAGLAVNAVNVVLNYLLIFDTKTFSLFGHEFTLYRAGMGVIGAGVASAVSVAAGGILICMALFRNKEISPRGVSFKPDKEILAPCLKVAFPNMLQRFWTSLGYVVFASMINALGEASTAAHTIANTVESAFYIPGFGMMTAAATLTGNAIGARDEEKRREVAKLIMISEVLMMMITGSLLFTFAEPMVRIFAKSEDVVVLGTTVLKMVAFSEPFYGIAIVIEGMLQGARETVKPFRYNVFSMWGVRILGTFICTRLLGFGLVAAWGCMIANNLTLCALFSNTFYHDRKKSMVA